jgi:hypothetical protein
VHVVFALEEVAPPTMVEMVYGRATGAEETGTGGAAFTVIVRAGLEVDVPKLPLAT